jgi:dTDP-4-amino-4,6-dideoxygalactose transaminase
MSNLIRLSRSSLGLEEREAVTRVLNDGYLGMGQEVRLFEQELQAYISPEVNVACVNTGTSALHLAVQACNIGPGDQVIIPSITYVASFQAVAATGATPIACDIDPTNGCISVKSAREHINSNTRAIMPVHYAGGYGDLEGIYELAQEYNLRVIEDAAHSFGGTYRKKPVGFHGDVICFSFDGIKNLTCGEGGAVVSKDTMLISKIQDLRLLAIHKDTEKRYAGARSWDFEVTEQGWRYHMSNINAAIGREQLKKISLFGGKRRLLVQSYIEALKDCPIELLDIDLEEAVPHIFVIKITNGKRDQLKEFLLSKGIETGIHYKPNHVLEKFKGSNCKQAELFWTQILTLPLHCNLSLSEISHICGLIKGYCR